MRTTYCTRCRRRRFLSSKDLCEVSFSHCTGNSAPWGTGDRNLMCALLSFLLLADVCLQNTISSSRDSAYVSFLHVGSRSVLRLSSGMFSNLMCYAIDPVFLVLFSLAFDKRNSFRIQKSLFSLALEFKNCTCNGCHFY